MAIFNNLKVVELASVLAGPSVGQFFAELGAEVIKVENLKAGGDVTRSWRAANEPTDDRSAYFCSCNWGKKSIAVDMTSPEGKEIVRRLIQRSDVVIASYKPGDAEKLGVSYAQLKAQYPQLIYGQITGYGPDSDRVGYDAVIQAEAGFMDLNGEKEGGPTKMPVALIDVLAAHHLKEALLLALLNKERTGEGSFVEVSLIQAAVSSLVNQATNWLVGKKLPTRQGSLHPNIAPYGESFITADDKRILLAIGSDRQFEDLCKLLGMGELAHDHSFSSNQKRVENRQRLGDLLSKQISKRQSKQLLQQIHDQKIPGGLVQNLKETFGMKEVQKMIIEKEGVQGVRSFAGTMNFQPHVTSLLPPPHFGEHTEEILAGLR